MNRGLSAGFLEPDEDSDEGESLAAIKRSYKPGGRDFDKTLKGMNRSDSEESEEGRKRLQGAKRLESDEDEPQVFPKGMTHSFEIIRMIDWTSRAGDYYGLMR